MRKIIPYGRQHIDQSDIDAVAQTLQSDWLTQGPAVKEFEDKFATYVGAKFAVAVANGTAALHLSNLALNLKKGQKIITTPITFAASANAALYCEAEVLFADIDPETFLIDLSSVRNLLETHPKGEIVGIVPVDFTGLPVNTEELRSIAKEFDCWIVEDACHAPGGFYYDSIGQEVKCGSGIYADLTCFSFHPVKHIACGEGGMITTNNEELYNKLLTLRTHGIRRDNLTKDEGGWYHEMHELGYNYRLPDLNCALGITQLAKAPEGLLRRIEIAKRYTEAFQHHPKIKLQKQPEGFQNAWHLYVIQVENRKGLYDYLREQQIFAQVHYIPAHLHPYYQSLGWREGDLPTAEKYYQHCLSIPMYPSLTNEEQEFVIEKVLTFVS